MTFKEEYERRKTKLLADKTINTKNRKYYKEILEYFEIKLKRINGNPKLDEANYKTLQTYLAKCKNVNKWFKNKDLKKITKKDIDQVYNDLEDEKLKPYGDRTSYYTKFFKSKPFEIIGKKELAKEVIQYTKTKKTKVQFIELKEFIKILDHIKSIEIKLFLWLCFDYGENPFSILQLKENNFTRQLNPDSKNPEYLLHLNEEIIKRSRTERSELNIFDETVRLLEQVLENKKDNEPLFNFTCRAVEKAFSKAVTKAKIRTTPDNAKPTLRTLRKSMCTYCLKNGWTTDEIKSRLGHKPSSNVLDIYVSYLAIGRHKSKRKVFENSMKGLQEQVQQLQTQTKQKDVRLEELNKKYEVLKNELKKITKELYDERGFLILNKNATKI